MNSYIPPTIKHQYTFPAPSGEVCLSVLLDIITKEAFPVGVQESFLFSINALSPEVRHTTSLCRLELTQTGSWDNLPALKVGLSEQFHIRESNLLALCHFVGQFHPSTANPNNEKVLVTHLIESNDRCSIIFTKGTNNDAVSLLAIRFEA